MQYIEYVSPDTGLAVREGARGDDFVTDVEYTVSGFDGTQNADWENIDNITPD